MGAREPGWWYGASANGWVPRLLQPLGWCYGILTARRMRRSPRYRAHIPVVCVGNFTAGGTGKTPFVALIVDLLRARGHAPVVLSRGFGGRIAGPHWVDPSTDTATDVGDEPLLLAEIVPVMLARDRTAGARAIERAGARAIATTGARAIATNSARANDTGSACGPRATVIVMDDGIQNPALAKDLTIAVIDAARGFGNARCIPAGPLRAPVQAQWPRVDALLLNVGNGTAPCDVSVTALVKRFAQPVLTAVVAPSGDVSWLDGMPVIAFAGIGVPERFFQTVAACGGRLLRQISFPDHHQFDADDAVRLMALAEANGATLLTTEKDYARLAERSGALADLRAASRTLPIKLQLDDASAVALADLIASRVPLQA